MAKQPQRETPFFDPMSIAWEEEGLFARDVNGQLVRFEAAQENDYAKDVTLTIDGEDVTVKKATPLTDSQGNIVTDNEGRTIPRVHHHLRRRQQALRQTSRRHQSDPDPLPSRTHAAGRRLPRLLGRNLPPR